jgi:thiol-disulfide isomerase/thioredoxin
MVIRLISRHGVVPVATIVAVTVVAAVAVVAWRNDFWSSLAANQRAAQTSPGASGAVTVYPARSRPQGPELRGQTLDGDELALVDLRGHVVVINVWGSWCQPCRKEAPDLARVARETAALGVRFVGVDTRDNIDAARAFVRTFEIPYPSLIDDDGSLMLTFNGVIPVSAVPSTVVVDPAGHIAARVVGIISYGTLRGLVDNVLAEAPSTAQKGGS